MIDITIAILLGVCFINFAIGYISGYHNGKYK